MGTQEDVRAEEASIGDCSGISMCRGFGATEAPFKPEWAVRMIHTVCVCAVSASVEACTTLTGMHVRQRSHCRDGGMHLFRQESAILAPSEVHRELGEVRST